MRIILGLLSLSVVLLANIGTVTFLRGEASIQRGSNIVEVKMGDDVESGDKIDTYAKSKMQIILNDDTIITLGSNTEYVINSYDDKNNLHAQMTLKSGLLKTITGKIGKIAPNRFKLKTKSATIGIRGTGWKTFIGANIENTVCFKGMISITTDKQLFELPAGNMLLITDGIAKKFKTNMKFFNAQIKRIEAKQKPKRKGKFTSKEEDNEDSKEPSNNEPKPKSKEKVDNEPKSEQQSRDAEVEDNEPEEESVENAPPEDEVDVEQEDEGTDESDVVEGASAPEAEDDIIQVTQDINTEVVSETVNQAVNEDIDNGAEPAFDITPIVEAPQSPNPSSGP